MYDHRKIEKKWQKFWEENKTFHFELSQNNYYALVMFPYPSGAGLHLGHPRSYTAVDVIARFRRAHGDTVLHPMGWDAFGLPAENFAIKSGVHPAETTTKSINNFRKQLKSLGLSYDWSREVNTSSPEYYKWTQWLFIKLFQAGLAYQKEAPVNWCPGCQTVLANEQVIDGSCERCDSKIEQKLLKQWFFRITNYAEELLSGLEDIDWPEKIKLMQKNWIGKSVGAKINFKLADVSELIEVFTTRPDTLYGATYLVLAPEHKLIENVKSKIENYSEVKNYQDASYKKTELERKIDEKEKTGVELKGVKAIHPLTGSELPIFISDYVLMDYGSGAIMAVPAHDERDWEFAKKFNLPIQEVISKPDEAELPYDGEGVLANSEDWSGWKTPDSVTKAIKWLEDENLGQGETKYKLRDWLVSRQRYWGAPIPVIHCKNCGPRTVSIEDLPVLLPDDVDFRPTGESPLARSTSFNKNVKCDNCGTEAYREIETMDTFVDSSWYFLRYIDPKNTTEPFDKNLAEKLIPADIYVGGAEHAVLHLLYSRFVLKALADILKIDIREPFKSLRNQGLVLASDGRKMSKSLGNVVNPDDIVSKYGADTLRTYQMFMGPFEDAIPWSDKSIVGVRRFLDKIFDLSDKVDLEFVDSVDTKNLIEETIDKVTKDIEGYRFNTSISALMIASNHIKKLDKISTNLFARFLQIINPFAPHLSAELWSKIGMEGSVELANWPVAELNDNEVINIIIQVNGKTKGIEQVGASLSEYDLVQNLKSNNKFSFIFDSEIKKVIFVPDKLINFVL